MRCVFHVTIFNEETFMREITVTGLSFI